MGVSFMHGGRETAPKKGARGSFVAKMRPEDGICAWCGEARDVKMTSLGKSWAPLNGTWWHVHAGGATCSPLCRVLARVHPGPYDALGLDT